MRLPRRSATSRSRHTGRANGSTKSAISARSRAQPLAVDRRLAEAGAERVVVRAQAVEQRVELVEMGEVADADRAAADLVLIGRADAAPRGADLARADGVLAQRVEVAVDRQDQRAGLGDHQHVGRDRRRPAPAMRSTSAFSAHGSSTTPLPITDGVPRTMPDGSSDNL